MVRQRFQNYLQRQILPGDRLALSIFDTTDIGAICDMLNNYCKQQFEQEIVSCAFAYFSVGATFVVCLSDSQQVVLKAYGDRHPLSNLIASFRVQQAFEYNNCWLKPAFPVLMFSAYRSR